MILYHTKAMARHPHAQFQPSASVTNQDLTLLSLLILAGIYYWFMAGSSVFQSLLTRWSEPVAPGATPASPYILSLPLHLAPALWFFWVSGTFGVQLSGWAMRTESAVSRTMVSILSGFAVLAYCFWFAGRAGLFSPTALGLICGALSLAALIGTKEFFKNLSAAFQEWSAGVKTADGTWGAWGKTVLAVGLFFLILQLLASHAPSVDRDDLAYHLYIPSAYLHMGAIQPPPFPDGFTFYHQIVNMSYVPVLFLGGESAAVLLNACWGLVLALAVYALAWEASENSEAAALAALCAWALPIRVHMAQLASSDLCVSCFALGGLWGLLAWKRSGRSSLLGLSALFSAFALNKYTSLVYFLSTVLIFLWISRRKPKDAALGLLLYGGLAALCLAPLAFYLWTLKGNPVYPLYFLGLPYDKLDAAAMQGWKGSQNLGTLGAIVKGSLAYLSPLTPMAAAGLVAWRALPWTSGLVLAWTILCFLFKYLSQGAVGWVPRYILAPLVAAPCVTLALWAISQEGSLLKKGGRIFLLVSWLVPGVLAAAAVARPQWALNLGLLGEEEFMSRFYPTEGWDMVQRVNALPDDAKVAAVDHQFLPLHYKDAAIHLLPLFYDDMQLSDPAAILAMLSSRGATHVLWVRAQWILTPSAYGMSMKGTAFCGTITCRWWESTIDLPFLRPVYETPGAVLFEVRR